MTGIAELLTFHFAMKAQAQHRYGFGISMSFAFIIVCKADIFSYLSLSCE